MSSTSRQQNKQAAAQEKRDNYKRSGKFLIILGLILISFSYLFIGETGVMFSSNRGNISPWVFLDNLIAFSGLCILVLGMIYAYATNLVSDSDLMS